MRDFTKAIGPGAATMLLAVGGMPCDVEEKPVEEIFQGATIVPYRRGNIENGVYHCHEVVKVRSRGHGPGGERNEIVRTDGRS